MCGKNLSSPFSKDAIILKPWRMEQPSPTRLAFPSRTQTSARLKRPISKTFWQVYVCSLTVIHPQGIFWIHIPVPSQIHQLLPSLQLRVILPVSPKKSLSKHLVLNESNVRSPERRTQRARAHKGKRKRQWKNWRKSPKELLWKCYPKEVSSLS